VLLNIQLEEAKEVKGGCHRKVGERSFRGTAKVRRGGRKGRDKNIMSGLKGNRRRGSEKDMKDLETGYLARTRDTQQT